jgi:2-polyprenyl-6-methoxyphenol hydroxylase-like FAD-dependent oxidoreductase
MKISIVGAGIGGLATALFLDRLGCQVRVFEAVPEIRELGVGINLLPHAVRELEKIGLGDRIISDGVLTKELLYFNRHGQQIWQEPRGIDAGYRWPQVSIHRGRLQRVLLDAVVERLGSDAVITGHRLVRFSTDAARARTVFATNAPGRSGGEHTEIADVAIAADGIHSAARRQMYPAEGAPVYSGSMHWRGTSRARPFLSGRSMFMAGYSATKFVAYPITAPDASGLCTINWIAEILRDRPLNREDWNRPGSLDDFLPAFESWTFDWLDVPALVRAHERVYEYPMVDRDPVERWTDGRVVLLGDAAHPMYPIGSNGASQAIRDASALADAFERYPDPDAALAAYEAVRREATTRIVLSNRKMGPEIVMQMAEDRAPGGFADVESVIPRHELEAVADGYKKIAGFSRDALNAGLSVLDGA